MLAAALLVFVLAGSVPSAQSDRSAPTAKEAPAPDPKRVEQAVTDLTSAFAKDQPPQRKVEAVNAAVDAADPRVITLVAKGLEDKEPQVVTATVDSLGRMRHEDALQALHSYAKREKKKLAENDVLFPEVLKAIGRHGSPSSIDILSDDPFSQRAYATVRARILSLGNIRSKRALERLIEMSKLVGPHRIEGAHGDFRLALARLTGRDLGADPVGWQAWWQEHKKTFEVPAEPPQMEPALQRQWNSYWGLRDKSSEEAGEGKREGGKRGDGKNGDGKNGDGKRDGGSEGGEPDRRRGG